MVNHHKVERVQKVQHFFLIVLLFILGGSSLEGQPGILKVGFDLDDTILYSRWLFEQAPRDSAGQLDYAWINRHDRDYSQLIPPMVTLVSYFRARGHEVYFITSRQPAQGDQLARFLTERLGFPVIAGHNLFFTPKERRGEHRYTTKQRVMKALDLDLFYGDADTDMIAALKADVHPVRVVRHPTSIQQWGDNYFGNTLDGNSPAAPFSTDDLARFYAAGVGLFGETIYPIIWEGPIPAK
jgi:acid phosphatase class B